MRERVTEIPGYHCKIHAPDAITKHPEMYFAPHCTMSWRWRVPIRRGECLGAAPVDRRDVIRLGPPRLPPRSQAAEESVLLVDRSADAKYMLTGPQVDEWLPGKVTTLLPATKAAAVLAPLLGKRGQIEALVRTLRWTEDSVMLVWQVRSKPPAWRSGCESRAFAAVAECDDVTTAYAMLELHGMRRAALLNSIGCPAQDSCSLLDRSCFGQCPGRPGQ